MYVVDVAENELTISIVALVFKAAAFYPIRLRIQFGSRVEDHDFGVVDEGLTIVRRPPDLHEHVFIVRRPPIVALRALRAPPHRRPRLLMKVCQRRQPVLRPEFRACFHLIIADRSRNNNKRRIGSAQIKFLIREEAELLASPQVDPLPLDLFPDVDEQGPAVDVVHPIQVIYVNFVRVREAMIEQIRRRNRPIHI